MNNFLALGGALVAAAIGGFATGYTDNAVAQRVTHVVWRVSPPDPRSNMIYRHITAEYKTWPVAEVTLLGDSLTQYGPWQRLLPNSSNIDNFGVSNDTSLGLLIRTSDASRIGKTAVVMIGTNDAAQAITPSETRSNLTGIIRNLKGHRVLLLSTLPVSDVQRSAQIAELAVFERDLCAATENCNFVDVASEMTKDGHIAAQYTTDGIHLSWAGYKHWATILTPYLANPSDDETVRDAGRAAARLKRRRTA